MDYGIASYSFHKLLEAGQQDRYTASFAYAIMRALSKDPEDRFATANEISAAME